MWITPWSIKAPTAKSIPMKRQNATRDAVMAQNRVLVKVVSMEKPPSVEREIFIAKLIVRCNQNHPAPQHEY